MAALLPPPSPPETSVPSQETVPPSPPARVVAVTPLESKRGADCLVTFETVRTLNAVPPVSPERGMNSYVAGDP